MFGWILLCPGFALKPRHEASAPAALSSWQGRQKEGQILLLSLGVCLWAVCRDSTTQPLSARLCAGLPSPALGCRSSAVFSSYEQGLGKKSRFTCCHL